MENKKFKRPLNGFNRVVEHHHCSGMQIVPQDEFDHPLELREALRLGVDDFVVTGFMASRNLVDVPGIGELVYLYANKIAELNHAYSMRMPPLSGGGIPNAQRGLMGEWARGVVEAGHCARFVTMQRLVEYEGLPLADGLSVCLKLFDGEERIGERGDKLHESSEIVVSFPGGFGTGLENYTVWTSISIKREEYWRRMVIVDPYVDDPDSHEDHPTYWGYDFKSLERKLRHNAISREAALAANKNCLVYRPGKGILPEQMCSELVALTLAVRQAAPIYAPHAGYGPLSPDLIGRHMIPFLVDGDEEGVSRSKVLPLFKSVPADWKWIEGLRNLRKPPNGGLKAELVPR